MSKETRHVKLALSLTPFHLLILFKCKTIGTLLGNEQYFNFTMHAML